MKLEYTESIPQWLHTRANEMIQRRVDLKNHFIHVTQLLQPAPMLILQDQHWEDTTVDPGNLIPAMMGTSWHKYVEGATPGGNAELKIEVPFEDWTIAGTPDWFDRDLILDFKTAKVWSRIYGKREWEEQLNIYRWLINRSLQRKPSALQVHVVYMDWTKYGVMRSADHPRKRWEVIDIPVWHLDDTEAFVHRRLDAIRNPQTNICSEEERWERDECWAVMKEGRKTALKLFKDRDEAHQLADQTTKGYVEHRPGNPVRCKDWCSVREFCPLGKNLEVEG